VVAHGLAPGSRSRLGRTSLIRLARVGGSVLLAGVVLGVGRWLADGSLDGDGASGVITTAYFLLGGALFSVLGWAPEAAAIL
jgi:hypothetical protein